MAKQFSHAELEGFSKEKQIQTTSWPIGNCDRVSVCTGWNGKKWISTVRIKTVSTEEFGPVLDAIESIKSEDENAFEAHKRAVFKVSQRDWSPT